MTPKVVMISGASRGIGAAIAEQLYDEGYALSLGLRHPDGAHKAKVLSDPKRIFCCAYDARQSDAGKTWVEETIKRYGRLDAVVNNAGIMRAVSLEDDDEECYDDLWNINVMAPLRVCRAALPHLKKAGSGRIINMVSLAGKRVRGNEAGYAMTKHALLALTHSIRKTGWPFGIRATAICPGLVATGMTSALNEPPPSEMVQPQDIARVVSMLLALPNNAAVAEIPINCRLEDSY